MGSASQLSELIKNCRKLVVFTGAGVSTSAGIPDYRGPQGLLTLKAQGRKAQSKLPLLKASPTLTHMSLVALQNAGILKFLISQNVDGLHMRSGINRHLLAELHGNTNLEVCQNSIDCGKEYLRDFECRRPGNHVNDHVTGRFCTCGGPLIDSIVNFGESLPKRDMENGFSHSKSADLFLVLGSSLTVSPANLMPVRAKENSAKLVICNLQKTPLDSMADLRIFAKTDDLMERVLAKLSISIPKWKLIRNVTVESTPNSRSNSVNLDVSGEELDGTPASFLSAVQVTIPKLGYSHVQKSEPYQFSSFLPVTTNSIEVQILLNFMGHFNEPPVALESALFPSNKCLKKFALSFDPGSGVWEVEVQKFKFSN